MVEPKPLASLSAGLLARKGEARPAIRRAYVSLTAAAPLPAALRHDEDLGWNDLGADSPPPRRQQEQIVEAFSPARAEPVATPRKAKVAFTLRLDADRHLRLRLASAVGKRSAQQIVAQALDAWLDAAPGLDQLAAQARRSPAG